MKLRECVIILMAFITPVLAFAGTEYWQQRVEYKMEIDFDVRKHQFKGEQVITYYNNSPDTLRRVFYHLYFNAFQPGSMMDVRSQNIPDPDRRVADRISKLKDNQTGYQKVKSLTQDGRKVDYKTVGTILEVVLDHPIYPGQSTELAMSFDAQVPIQIRRSGRDNAEGIAYSMAQWYPKLCEYDEDGWHPNPYIGREFYGVWGDFDVYITIDKEYTIGGTGYLQNANEIGHGYLPEGQQPSPAKGKTLTWHFKAPNVHDFMWGADPDYTHTMLKSDAGPTLHFFYQETPDNKDAWEKLPGIMNTALNYMNEHFGEYPYDQYSFVQGGDGGMEYPMSTLITGNRPLNSLVGVSVHEWMHSWYQMVLGTNESLYPWMDEGFTSYASARTMNELAKQGLLPGREYNENPWAGTYRSFANFSTSGAEEALTTHADHYTTNSAYGVGSYVKGNIYLNQLNYVIGKEAFDETLLQYYNQWKFKHPDAMDFIRVAEHCSGMVLDWYHEYWVNQTHNIDYAIGEVDGKGKRTNVTLIREGVMPMPSELKVTLTNGEETIYYIPLRMMRGAKPAPDGVNWVQIEDWPWTNPELTIELPVKKEDIATLELDPSQKVMDVNRENDVKTVNSKS